MQQDRLFFVAPEAVNLRLTHDAQSGYWRLAVSVSRSTPDGAMVVTDSEVYEDLSLEEAHDTWEVVMMTLTGL